MPAKKRTAAETADYDQAKAAASGYVDVLLDRFRRQTARYGPEQALANTARALHILDDRDLERSMLLITLERLAGHAQRDD